MSHLRALARQAATQWRYWLLALVIIPASLTGTGFADPTTQNQVYMLGSHYYDLNANACGIILANKTIADDVYISQPPTGDTTKSQIFNFFTQQVGLSAAATAGIMGNMQAESGFNPAAEEAPGSWQDTSDELYHAVGLVQWDGGRRPALFQYASAHATDRKDILLQLNYVWHELNTSHADALNGGTLNGVTYVGLKTVTDPAQAALTFHALYEISADSPEKVQGRMDKATAIFNDPTLTKGGFISPANAADGCGNSLSPDCLQATGNARIVCQAKVYDTVSYFEGYEGGHQGAAQWHKDCPIVGPTCVLDCSGLVNIAVYDVYGVDINENTAGERADSDLPTGSGQYWKSIPASQVLPGDIVQPNPDHVEIIDHVQGTTLFTFAAHTNIDTPQPDQVGPASYPEQPNFVYFRYVGPGI